MNSAKHSVAVAMLVLVLISCWCPFYVPELVLDLSDLTLCQGWNIDGNPIVLSDTVSPDEPRICVCGNLETNRDVMLQVFWSHGREILLTHRQIFSNGPFLSCIEEDEGFESGSYRVNVIAGKKEIGRVDFSVCQESDINVPSMFTKNAPQTFTENAPGMFTKNAPPMFSQNVPGMFTEMYHPLRARPCCTSGRLRAWIEFTGQGLLC